MLGARVPETAGLAAAVLGAAVLADGVAGARLPTWEPGVLGEQPASATMAAQTQPDSAKERREKVIMYRKTPQNSIGLAVPGHNLTSAVARRSFRKVTEAAGLNPADWTPRELRHSFVSLLSDADVPIEQISRLVGHSGTTTTETIYRKQIRPVITEGAQVMDRLFPRDSPDARPGGPDA